MALFGGGRSGSVGREEAEAVEIWGRGRVGIQLRYPDFVKYSPRPLVFGYGYGFGGQVAYRARVKSLKGPRSRRWEDPEKTKPNYSRIRENRFVACCQLLTTKNKQSVNTRTSEDDELRDGWLLAMRCRNELSEAVA